MTEEEIAKLLGYPHFDQIVSLAQDRECLRLLLNIAITEGKILGGNQAFLSVNKAFRGYTKTTIEN